MSTTYRNLRHAVDRLVETEDGVTRARQAHWDAVADLGKAIRACREYKGMGLRECARQAKIAPMTLHNIEMGRRTMSDGTCEMILGVLLPIRQLK